MSIARIDGDTSALLRASQHVASLGDVVLSVLLFAVDTLAAPHVELRIAPNLALDCIVDGAGCSLDALDALAAQLRTHDAAGDMFARVVSPLAHVIVAARTATIQSRTASGGTVELLKTSDGSVVCMRAAAPRAALGTTLRLEQCFAGVPARYAWLTGGDVFAAQLVAVLARVERFAAAHPRLALRLCREHIVLLNIASHDAVDVRMARLFPELAPVPLQAQLGGGVRVARLFAAATLAHSAATQIVYWNGEPVSAAHHEPLFGAVDAILARRVAPQGRVGVRQHASFAVFLEGAATGAVLARQVEAITDLAIGAAAVRDAMRAALGVREAAGTLAAGRDAPTSTPASAAAATTLLQFERIGAPSSEVRPRQSVQELFAAWSNPTMQRAASAVATTASAPNEVTLERGDMAEWRFVAQVDRKYLLLWWPQRQLLLAADQHAVDERVNLERLEERVFGDVEGVASRAVPLANVQVWPVTSAQARLLRESGAASAARRWGFRFAVSETATAAAVAVSQAPTIESTQLDVAALLDIATCGAHARPAAVERVLHNKACRSAIMFGDALSGDECAALVAAWRGTKRPFVCAHGRPSVVPVQRFAAAVAVRDDGGQQP